MAFFNLPSVSAPAVGVPQLIGPSAGGGSASQTVSRSRSRPELFRPDADAVQGSFNTLQGGIELNNPQQQAVEVQQTLGQTLKSLLADAEQQGTTRINQGFQQAGNAEAQRLASRGLDPSMVGETASRGAARESALSTGDLMDQLLNREVGAEQNVSREISNLLFGSSEQATDLINALLGSGSIGNFTQSKSSSSSKSSGL